MAVDFSQSLGLENAARGVLLVLLSDLNDEIDAQEALWGVRDSELAAARTVVYHPVHLEHVRSENFYLGHIPPLIDAPADSYPNVACMGFRATPLDSPFDQDVSSWNNRIFVEAMVKSKHDQQECYARLMRTADAVAVVIQRDPTLGGTHHGLQSPAEVLISDVFRMRDEDNAGPKFWWQAARLEYEFTHDAA